MTGALLLLAVFAPALASGALVLLTRRRRIAAELAGRVAAMTAATAFLLAIVVAASVAGSGALNATATPFGAGWPIGAQVDQLAVVLLLLVTGVSAVVQAFAVRYLRGDGEAIRFATLAGVLTTGTAATVAAPTLVACAVAWSVTSLALVGLVGLYRDPASQTGVRQTMRALAFSDASLWLAVLVATAAWGAIDLRDLAARVPEFTADPATTALVACLLVGAAVGRSAQVPLHGWLTSTLAAPTPVSALLHAGVVNGGGMLLITLAPIFGASALATHLAFLVGAVTVVVGTTLMLVRPDVKGSLALSTVGQMGFMIMTCGLGAYAAATFHLVAHGMYKASLFLGSGGAIARHVRHHHAPAAPTSRMSVSRAAQAIAVPSIALFAAASLLPPATGPGARDATALLLFAWATAMLVGWRWLSLRPSPAGRAAHVAFTAGASVAYVAAVHGLATALAPALAGAGTQATTPWLLVPVVAVLALLALLRRPARSPLHTRVQRALYVAALAGGDAKLARQRPRRPFAAARGTGPLLSEGNLR